MLRFSFELGLAVIQTTKSKSTQISRIKLAMIKMQRPFFELQLSRDQLSVFECNFCYRTRVKQRSVFCRKEIHFLKLSTLLIIDNF